jgi:SAM-dependent methyltransferase
MTPNSSPVYTPAFFEGQRHGSAASADAVIAVVRDLVGPIDSVVDIGCGVGHWTARWASLGVTDVLGVDGDYVDRDSLAIPASQFLAADLTQPIHLGRRFDLAMSLEVAEHLDSEYANQFVDTLTSCSDVILFSAAAPGQGGTHHVNEQWPTYWCAKFNARGFQTFDLVRERVWSDENVADCYRQNTLIFARGAIADRLAAIPQSTIPLNLIHPATWDRRALEHELATPTLRELVRALPAAIRASVSHHFRTR